MLSFKTKETKEKDAAVATLGSATQLYLELSATFSREILDKFGGWSLQRAREHLHAGKTVNAEVCADIALRALLTFKKAATTASQLGFSHQDQVVYRARSELLRQYDAQLASVRRDLDETTAFGFADTSEAQTLQQYMCEASVARNNGDLGQCGFWLWHSEQAAEPVRKVNEYARVYGYGQSKQVHIVEAPAEVPPAPAPAQEILPLEELLKDISRLSRQFRQHQLMSQTHETEQMPEEIEV